MSMIKVDNLQTTGGAGLYPARAWVNFDGSGTVAIRDSDNVSSITDNGVGNYTTNFTDALSSANFCCNFCGNDDGTTAGLTDGYGYGSLLKGSTSIVYTTSSIRLGVGYPANASHYDISHINISIIN